MPQIVLPTTIQETSRPSRFTATGGTIAAVVKDGSDATYIRRSSAGSPGVYLRLGVPAIPASTDVATVVPSVRFKQPTGTAPKVLSLNLYARAHGKTGVVYVSGPKVGFPGVYSSAVSVTADASMGAANCPEGASWLIALLAGTLGIAIDDGHAYNDANRDTIYEVSALIFTAARPTCSIAIDATTPLNATSFPAFDVTVSALIEAWQDNVGAATSTDCTYQLRVFTAAQVAAQGFDPAVSPAYWETSGAAPLNYIDGVTASTTTPVPVADVPLMNGSYTAYARATRGFECAVPGAWSTYGFTVAVAPPNAPTVSAVLDDANQRVAVTVTPVATTGATGPVVWLQRSSDAGATWSTVRGVNMVAGAFGSPVTYYDYEAPRSVALIYRALVVATISAQSLASVWTSASVAGTLTSREWNVKCPTNPALNALGVSVLKDPSYTQDEELAVFRPIGRKYPVAVSLSLGGADGSLTIDTGTAGEWSAISGLMSFAGTLLLESPFGWSRYIRVTGRSWSDYGTATAPRRSVKWDFLEVECPDV